MARLLLMEDDAEQRTFLAQTLERAGHDVDTCFSASEAMHMAKSEAYDLVITDIIVQVGGRSLPDGGISLIGKLRRVGSESRTLKTVPILAISGTYKNPGMEHILTAARQVGADAKLEKPVAEEDLLDTVEELLRRADSLSA